MTVDLLISSKKGAQRSDSLSAGGLLVFACPGLKAMLALGAVLGATAAMAADMGPVIVIPGRLGAPVILNGVDVSGAIVEGDFGLASPHMVDPRVVYGPVAIPEPLGPGGYYPAFGRRPGYGRHEIEPPPDRRLPPPAQSYHRSWSSHSAPVPASLDPPVQTPMLIAPEIYPQRQRGGRGP
jgi:hypothetical protein